MELPASDCVCGAHVVCVRMWCACVCGARVTYVIIAADLKAK